MIDSLSSKNVPVSEPSGFIWNKLLIVSIYMVLYGL